MPPSSGPPYLRPVVDGGLAVAALACAVFVVIANRPPLAARWPPGGVAVSRAAVARDPLDPAALRDLGLALDLAGDEAGADRLMTLTGERTRRDTPTAAWLLVRRLSQGRYADAFANADALLRRDLDDRTRERLFALLIAAAHYDVSRPALVARLAEAPWWRPAFMRELAARAEPADIHAVMTSLAVTASPPAPDELDAYVSRLVADNAYAEAAREWRAFSRPRRDPDVIGDLAAPPPFGWSPVSGEGASSTVEGGTLRVDYDGYGAASLPSRLIAMPPGRYSLSWRERVSGDDVRAIAVSVLCGTNGATLATSPPLDSGPAFHDRTLDFEVAPAGCEGQTLRIVPLPGGRRATVGAVFDQWRLIRR